MPEKTINDPAILDNSKVPFSTSLTSTPVSTEPKSDIKDKLIKYIKDNKFRILSLDGGGIRGIITVEIIRRVLIERPDFLKKINMFSGVSTGGIISLMLANGNDIDEIADFYINKSKFIFHKRNIISRIFNSKYLNDRLESELKKIFGTKRITELEKKILIPAFDLETSDKCWSPKFFHNFNGYDKDYEYIYKIAMATSAAPTYFPVYEGYIDGGIVCNNPSMAALAQSQDNRNDEIIPIWNVKLLSIGTGYSLDKADYYSSGVGFIGWATKLLGIMFSGLEGVPTFECKEILKNGFYRLNPVLPYDLNKMDDLNSIPKLIDVARNVDITELIKWIDE